MVRYRKLQLLYIAALLIVAACVMVGGMIVLFNQ